jgi:hypothetical protein
MLLLIHFLTVPLNLTELYMFMLNFNKTVTERKIINKCVALLTLNNRCCENYVMSCKHIYDYKLLLAVLT